MFRYPEDLQFTTMTPKSITASTVPTSWNGIKFAPAPRMPDSVGAGGEGAALVMQYVEGYMYRTYGLYRVSDAKATAILAKAREIEAATDDEIDPEDYPQLKTLLEACQLIANPIVCNGTGNLGRVGAAAGFVSNTPDHLKYYIRQYGQLILETKITSTTYNQYGYTIDGVGESLEYENYSKGFIAYGYDANYIYMQNSLGPFAGKLGFHRMSWNVVPALVRRGACWWLKNPS